MGGDGMKFVIEAILVIILIAIVIFLLYVSAILLLNFISLAFYIAGCLIHLMFNVALPWRWKHLKWQGWSHHRDGFIKTRNIAWASFVQSWSEDAGRTRSAPNARAPNVRRTSDHSHGKPEDVYIEFQGKNGQWLTREMTSSDSVDIAMIRYQNSNQTYNKNAFTGQARARGVKSGLLYGSFQISLK